MSEWQKGVLIIILLVVAMLTSTAILSKSKKSDIVDEDAQPLYKSPDILGMNNFNSPSEEDHLNSLPKAKSTSLIVFISIVILIILALKGVLSI